MPIPSVSALSHRILSSCFQECSAIFDLNRPYFSNFSAALMLRDSGFKMQDKITIY